MTDKQPEALRLADELDSGLLARLSMPYEAAAELRRLHAQRDELLEALERIEMAANATVCNTKWIAEHAKAAIAKAEAK